MLFFGNFGMICFLIYSPIEWVEICTGTRFGGHVGILEVGCGSNGTTRTLKYKLFSEREASKVFFRRVGDLSIRAARTVRSLDCCPPPPIFYAYRPLTGVVSASHDGINARSGRRMLQCALTYRNRTSRRSRIAEFT